MPRYRFRKASSPLHSYHVVRDDGYRLCYWSEQDGEWQLLSEYKNADHPGIAGQIIEIIMADDGEKIPPCFLCDGNGCDHCAGKGFIFD